jgi:hypothetical protein
MKLLHYSQTAKTIDRKREEKEHKEIGKKRRKKNHISYL